MIELVGERCVVRGARAADASSIARHANNRKVWQNLRDMFPHPYAHSDAEAWIARHAGESPAVSFVIDVDGEAIGSIGLRIGADIERCGAELGYWLGEPFWGRGIASDAIMLTSAYGFEALGLLRIFAVPFAGNAPSQRVLEKAGFSREGVMRRAAIKDGAVQDLVLYARLREA